MDRIEIKTGKELRAALRTAKIILMVPRFGTNETWVKISKSEVKTLVAGIKPTDTADMFEMGTGIFGDLEGDTLYLG